MQEIIADLESQLSHLKSDHAAHQTQSTQLLFDMEGSKNQLLDRLKSVEARLYHSQSEHEQRVSEMQRVHEAEIEAVTGRGMQEVQEGQRRSEEALSALKGVYEREKEVMEGRVIEERDRMNKRMASI